jgi:hypothetical protein
MTGFIDRGRGTVPRKEVVVGGAALALALLSPARAWAGVEYVTSTTNCSAHIAGSGNSLTVMAGPAMTFEVWGNSVDLADPNAGGFKFAGPPGFNASVVLRRSGADNNGRGCGFVGSAVVRVNTDANTFTTSVAASVSFKMPLGDFSSLAMTIVPHPTLNQATWTTSGSLQPSNMSCIVKTGSISTVNQDTKLVIQLPPGSAQDQTTCTSNVIEVRMHTAPGSADVMPNIKYNVTGLPAFVTVSQNPATATPFAAPLLSFTFNVAATRGLTAASNSTITIANPIATNRTTTLTLQVTPTPGQGFSQIATANPASTIAGNPIDFTVNLSAPAAAHQVITWRMTQATCFGQASSGPAYVSANPFQFFTVPPGVTSAIIRVASVNAGGCTNKLAPTTQIFEAWIGDSRVNPQVTAVTTGPTYTRVNIALLFP